MASGRRAAGSISPRGLLAALVVACCPATTLAQVISDLEVRMPRDFGYTIGDRFVHELRVTLRPPQLLRRQTLPALGKVDRWLEIVGCDLHAERRGPATEFRVTVEYQVFNAPREPGRVTTPQLEFLTTGGPRDVPVFLPEWTFTMVPVAAIVTGDPLTLRPDNAPPPVPLFRRQLRLLLSTTVFATLLFLIAYRRWLSPWLRRDNYPFMIALGQLRALRKEPAAIDAGRRGLQALHTAVNRTAGQVVFAGNLDALFAANAGFRALDTELADLYAKSREVFFNTAPDLDRTPTLDELIALCRRCHTLERQRS